MFISEVMTTAPQDERGALETKTYQELEINVILRNIDTIQENSQVFRDDMDRLAKEIEDAKGGDGDKNGTHIRT